MNVENPTNQKAEIQEAKSPPNVSEQFKTQRNRREYEEVKNHLKDLFNRHKTGSERAKELEDWLEPFLPILSEEQKEYMANAIEKNANLTEKDEFVEKMFLIAKYYLDIKAGHLDQFETIERQRIYKEHPTYKELNQLFAYEFEDDEIRLHVSANKGTSIKDKLRLIDNGLKKLAEIVRGNPKIKQVTGRSWIAGENPKLLGRLGFEVTEIEANSQGIKIGLAMISREKLLEMHGK